MLEIRETPTPEKYNIHGENIHITEAFERNQVTGYIAYSYDGDRTTVHALDDGGDIMLCDGLIRSVIFKSCLKSISTLEIKNNIDTSNIKKLRFITGDNLIIEDIDRFMNGCADCKHKP